MLNVKNTILDSLISVVAPHLCSGCGRIGGAFCDNCKYDIGIETFTNCIICNKLALMGVCDDHKAEFNQACVVGTRNGSLQRLIGGYKFRNMRSSAQDLAELLDKVLPPLPAEAVFVPIPTTPVHIRERGYDHTLLIARRLGRLRHRPVRQLLKRDNTLVQHKASRRQRLSQVATAFRVEGVIDPYCTYIILDDIVTTGATIQQASRLLKSAGAVSVWVAVTSRQSLD